MNDKQAIIDNAKQNGFTYPKARVIFGFVSTGGAVGGFLFGLMLLFGSMIEALTISLNELFAVFFMMVSFAVFLGCLLVLCLLYWRAFIWQCVNLSSLM